MTKPSKRGTLIFIPVLQMREWRQLVYTHIIDKWHSFDNVPKEHCLGPFVAMQYHPSGIVGQYLSGYLASFMEAHIWIPELTLKNQINSKIQTHTIPFILGRFHFKNHFYKEKALVADP